eukprot:3572657-Rhodomonas_salina.2
MSLVGLTTNFPFASMPTATPATGVSNGILLERRAADAEMSAIGSTLCWRRSRAQDKAATGTG